MSTLMPWLLMIAFAGSNPVVMVERFETEALCNSASLAVVEFYSQRNVRGWKPQAWECRNISDN